MVFARTELLSDKGTNILGNISSRGKRDLMISKLW